MTEDNQRPAHSLMSISSLFRRIGSDGDWQLRIHPTGPALWMGMHTINGVLLHMHSRSTSAAPWRILLLTTTLRARSFGDWPAGGFT